jgi:hypothetical protein
MNAFQLAKHVAQGLKPAFFRALNGTAEEAASSRAQKAYLRR